MRKSELSLLARLERGSNLLLDVTLKAALAHRLVDSVRVDSTDGQD
jgi:hypothetical protein